MSNRKLSKEEILNRYFRNSTMANNYYERWRITETDEMWECYCYYHNLAAIDAVNITKEAVAC